MHVYIGNGFCEEEGRLGGKGWNHGSTGGNNHHMKMTQESDGQLKMSTVC